MESILPDPILKLLPCINSKCTSSRPVNSVSFLETVNVYEHLVEDPTTSFVRYPYYSSKHKSFGKKQFSTEDLRKQFKSKLNFRADQLHIARQVALDLADELGIVPIMVSFIVDTGAGVHLRCAAPGLTTRNIKDMRMMSANGPVTSSKSTRVKFRKIRNQNCIVLENTPDVLSVGQLVAQGYNFHWVNSKGASPGAASNYLNLSGVDGERCYL